MPRLWFAVGLLALACVAPAAAADAPASAKTIQAISPNVLPENQREAARSMLSDNLRKRLKEANARSSAEWQKLSSKEDWEKYRQEKLAALARSLGSGINDTDVKVRVTGELKGDGYRIENVLFSHDGQNWVTGNLYLPAAAVASPPGIIISCSHHSAKTSGEIQDMGMTWARRGCAVLAVDHLGYGERAIHPFTKPEDYPASTYALGRQSYYFRYDTSLQLALLGDSYIGALVGDLKRGVSVLLSHAKCDPKKITLLGSVAGGGDPAAVAGALDERITCVGPFNFGGPQPESKYPLPDDAETSFNYAGSGGWESTRNLLRSASDGFLPWVIVGSIAPRRLIYGHEFSWDEARDPVWKRFTRIYQWEGAPENQAVAHGRGLLSGRPPEATHCDHIGREHRKMIHPALAKWFDIQVRPEDEYSERRPGTELRAWTDAAREELQPRKWNEIESAKAEAMCSQAFARISGLPRAERVAELRKAWAAVLGPVDPPAKVEPVIYGGGGLLQPVKFDYGLAVLEPEPGIRLPLLLIPAAGDKRRSPCVVAFAQAGKEAFLRERVAELARLHEAGIAVCLFDLRGTGETRDGSDRDQYSEATSHSSSEWMLGGTLLGARLRDLRSVLVYLREQKELDPKRLALWGDSFTKPNPPETVFAAPRRIDGRPRVSEPLGQLLCLLAPLFEEDVIAVYFAGGLVSFREVLATPFVYMPHDAVVPGMLGCGDIETLLAARRCRTAAARWVDAYNRSADPKLLADKIGNDQAGPVMLQVDDPAAWLINALK